MRVCVVTFVECWQDDAGNWLGPGGFPPQMTAIGNLFSDMTMLVVGAESRSGGIPLPKHKLCHQCGIMRIGQYPVLHLVGAAKV